LVIFGLSPTRSDARYATGCGGQSGCEVDSKPLGIHAELCLLKLGFRDQVADALHNDPMGPAELHAFQLAGTQELINSAPTDIEHIGSASDGYGQAIVEIDELNVATFAHAAKIGAI
jgi:hypothetical protein